MRNQWKDRKTDCNGAWGKVHSKVAVIFVAVATSDVKASCRGTSSGCFAVLSKGRSFGSCSIHAAFFTRCGQWATSITNIVFFFCVGKINITIIIVFTFYTVSFRNREHMHRVLLTFHYVPLFAVFGFSLAIRHITISFGFSKVSSRCPPFPALFYVCSIWWHSS